MQVQCMRGQGWKRFLVFAQLTKHRKGADYVALFTYFQFSSAPRIIFAEAGRQVVNGVTLWSLTQKNVVPLGDHAARDGTSPFIQFWDNLGGYFSRNVKEAIVFCTMLFTLVIFVISALSLIAAIILYIAFLWHYVPQSDGRLSNYCKRKIDKRLTKIVGDKVKQAVSADSIQSIPTDKFGSEYEKAGIRRQPTLPDLDVCVTPGSAQFGLVRDDTSSSMKSFGSKSSSPSRPAISLRQQPSLPNIEPGPAPRPRFPVRSDTMQSGSTYSNKSYESNAPLLRHADGMGYSAPSYPMQPMSRGPPGMAIGYGRPPPGPRPNIPGPMSYAPPIARAYTGPEAYGSAQADHQIPNVVELPTGPRSVVGTSQARSVAGTMSTYSTNTNGEDSYTRLMANTSFNRPFLGQDKPNISPVSGPTGSISTMSQTSLIPEALLRSSPDPPRPTRSASRYPSTVISMAPSAAPSRGENYTPFNPDASFTRASSPFNSSDNGSHVVESGHAPQIRRVITAPAEQMPAMPRMPPHMQSQRPGGQQQGYPRAPQRSATDPFADQRRF